MYIYVYIYCINLYCFLFHIIYFDHILPSPNILRFFPNTDLFNLIFSLKIKQRKEGRRKRKEGKREEERKREEGRKEEWGSKENTQIKKKLCSGVACL